MPTLAQALLVLDWRDPASARILFRPGRIIGSRGRLILRVTQNWKKPFRTAIRGEEGYGRSFGGGPRLDLRID